MNHTTHERCPEEMAEIEKHKYFLSEQAGHDVGWEFAEQDWEAKFAPRFRAQQRSDEARPGGVATLLRRVFTFKAR